MYIRSVKHIQSEAACISFDVYLKPYKTLTLKKNKKHNGKKRPILNMYNTIDKGL